MFTYYHGTSKEKLDSIMRLGLVPNAGKGADAWATSIGYAMDFMEDDEGSVFLTTNFRWASAFAKAAGEVNHADAVVLRIELPQPLDEHDDNWLEERYREAMYRATQVPPAYIVGVEPPAANAYSLGAFDQ